MPISRPTWARVALVNRSASSTKSARTSEQAPGGQQSDDSHRLDSLSNALERIRSEFSLLAWILIAALPRSDSLRDVLQKCGPCRKRVCHEVLPRRGLLANTSGNKLSIAGHRHGSIRWVEVVANRDGIEPGRNRNQSCCCAVAAPDPLSRSLPHPATNTIP